MQSYAAPVMSLLFHQTKVQSFTEYMPELYTYHFRVREESCFMVKGNFPRITPKNIRKGIGAVEYVVSLDACRSYMIEIESFYKGVDYQ